VIQSASVDEPQPARQRHSIFGLISLAAGLISVTIVGGGLALLIFLTAVHRGQVDMTAFEAMLTALCAAAGGPLAIVGVGAGVAGFFEQDRRRLFNILGIALNGASLLLLAAIVVLGVIAHSRVGPPPNL
jgi:hypothetical protein